MFKHRKNKNHMNSSNDDEYLKFEYLNNNNIYQIEKSIPLLSYTLDCFSMV